MNKKKRKKTGGHSKRRIRISQCMIVKNEEMNIERALGWARDIAFEQIVVDTGSTDRTVQIAEKLGARVYHFDWTDDFAAAKNYAIEQATGDWIAFLDADEYFSPEDAKELTVLLREIEDSPEQDNYQGITCSWVQLDDEGNIFSVLKQERVFRNDPGIRYIGRIHERLTMTKYNVEDLNLRIMHTGYSKSLFEGAGKYDRNIKMLRSELKRDPDNIEIMIYLADALKSSMKEEDEREAEGLFRRALDSGKPAHSLIKKLAYDFLIPYYMRGNIHIGEAMRLCGEAVLAYPEYLDFLFYSGTIKNRAGDYSGAIRDLIKCREMLKNTKAPLTRILLPDAGALDTQITIAENYLNTKGRAGLQPNDAKKRGFKLSQCMIVKNEEKNIERALGWARDIAFEQIVVDTGSTDRTVLLAQQLGAKVFHFDWIDDFSAAKNYAIEQASGDWIAFLDADEYFATEDTGKLADSLDNLASAANSNEDAILFPLINLNDFDKPSSVLKQIRMFRNLPGLRYINRIHEVLTVDPARLHEVTDIPVYHTGYRTEVYLKTGKSEFYAGLLRKELEDDPENLLIKGHLADALRISTDEKSLAQAGELYRQVLESDVIVSDHHRKNAFLYFIDELSNKPDSYTELMQLCEKAFQELSDDIDFEYIKTAVLINKGRFEEGRIALAECYKRLVNDSKLGERIAERDLPTQIFCKVALAAKEIGDIAALIEYITITLSKDKHTPALLPLYISAFKKFGVSDNELIGLLEKLYNFANVRDKMFIVRAAKDCRANELAQTVMAMIKPEEVRGG